MHHPIWAVRYHAATAIRWPGRSYRVPPAQWKDTAQRLATQAPVEVRLAASDLRDLDVEAMIAAAGLRDAGIGLALAGAGMPDHLVWLRRLPWSAVIAHPALADDAAGSDRERVRDLWAEATRRRGMHFISPLHDLARLPSLEAVGFTHGEIGAAELAPA